MKVDCWVVVDKGTEMPCFMECAETGLKIICTFYSRKEARDFKGSDEKIVRGVIEIGSVGK